MKITLFLYSPIHIVWYTVWSESLCYLKNVQTAKLSQSQKQHFLSLHKRVIDPCRAYLMMFQMNRKFITKFHTTTKSFLMSKPQVLVEINLLCFFRLQTGHHFLLLFVTNYNNVQCIVCILLLYKVHWYINFCNYKIL